MPPLKGQCTINSGLPKLDLGAVPSVSTIFFLHLIIRVYAA